MVGKRVLSPVLIAAGSSGHYGERKRSARATARAAGSLLSVAAALALLAMPASASDRIEARFEIFGFVGLHLLTTQTSADVTPDGYSIAIDINTRGIVDAFVDLHSRSEVYGTLSKQNTHPEVYRSAVRRNGTERDYGIKYLADGAAIITQAPPRRQRIQIDPEQLRGTVDQLTAYFLIERQLSRTGSCAAVVPVYDGNELYRMRFTDIKDETLAPTGHQNFAGTARLCEVVREVVVANPDLEESTYDRGRLWYARLLSDGRMLPVRMVYETPFGDVSGYLTDLNGLGVHRNFEGE